MYSALVAPATPVGRSRLVISTQMRWPRRNRLAVDRISTAYSSILPGSTGRRAARVSLCHRFHGFERARSSARSEALSQPRVNSRSGRSSAISRSPSRTVRTETSGPVDVEHQFDAVAHWHDDIEFADDTLVLWCTLVGRRRTVTGCKYVADRHFLLRPVSPGRARRILRFC